MGRGRTLLAAGFVIAVAAALLWALKSGPPAASLTPRTDATQAARPQTQSPSPTVAHVAKQQPGGPYESTDPRWAELRENRLRDPAWEWKRPIEFFGRVVDELGMPIAGASVQFEWSDLSESGVSNATATTDGTGEFELTGQTGSGLTVRVSKKGYYSPSGDRRRFEYAQFWAADYHVPARDRPMIFRLRKVQQGQQLTAGHVRVVLPPTGAPLRLDLLAEGRVSPSGQLEISASTNTDKHPPAIFDWSASIAVPGGGLIERKKDQSPFEAPTYGYAERIDVHMPASTPSWVSGMEKDYFVQFGSPPLYGRIQVRLYGSSHKATVEYVINPSGSPILEPTEAVPAVTP